MSLSEHQLSDLCRLALTAAREAGAHIARRSGDRLEIRTKADADTRASQIVTQVDLEAEALIVDRLGPSMRRFDLGLCTEERRDDGSRFANEHFWSIDPLDGTLPFVEGAPGYAVSIALVSREGEALLGAVFDPVTATAYHAMRGRGAFRNELPFAPHANEPRDGLTLFADRSLVQSTLWSERRQALEEIVGKLKVVATGGAVMNALWALENAPALYLKLPRDEPGGGSVWDFAATARIFGEAGAVATDIYGDPLDLNRRASTFMNHRGALFASSKAVAQLGYAAATLGFTARR